MATVEPFRTALKDVCISRNDRLTEGTAQQIEANNLALRKLLDRGSQCPKSHAGAGDIAPRSRPPVQSYQTPTS